jgi:hypothetical protein
MNIPIPSLRCSGAVSVAMFFPLVLELGVLGLENIQV